jgi:ferritin
MKINDPNNPGRTYFSGKGLDYPFRISPQYRQKLEQVTDESQKQVHLMLAKTNDLLQYIKSPFSFEFEDLRNEFAKKLVRERHIAKAIRVKLHESFSSDSDKISFLKDLYKGKEQIADIRDNTRIEEEIRANLLKAGGAAYVPEDVKAFLPVPEIISIIIDAGGIPCYPVLLDDKSGNYTDFEHDRDQLAERLIELGVGCIELIPGRNKFEDLIRFVGFMEKRGFIILFGTEHNTPQLMPLTVKTSDRPLDSYLTKVAYEGACVVAAHQYLKSGKEEGFIDEKGMAKTSSKEEFVLLGKAVIEKFLSEKSLKP